MGVVVVEVCVWLLALLLLLGLVVAVVLGLCVCVLAWALVNLGTVLLRSNAIMNPVAKTNAPAVSPYVSERTGQREPIVTEAVCANDSQITRLSLTPSLLSADCMLSVKRFGPQMKYVVLPRSTATTS